MGCSESSAAEVVESKKLTHPPIVQVSGNKGTSFYMGEIKPNTFVYKILEYHDGKGVKLTDHQMPKLKPAWPSLQYPNQVPFNPTNFAQITPLDKGVEGEESISQYIMTGGITCALDNIANEAYLLHIDSNNPSASLVLGLPKMKQARYTHCAVYHKGWLYVLGGRHFGDDDQAILSSCQRLNAAAWVDPDHKQQGPGWEQIPHMAIKRCTHISYVLRDKLYVMGGYTGDCQRSTVIQCLDLQNIPKGWAQLDVELPYGIESAITVPRLYNNRLELMILGGNTNHGPSNSVFKLDISDMTIASGKRLRRKRMLHKGILVGASKLLMLGGGSEQSKAAVDLEMYDLSGGYNVEGDSCEMSPKKGREQKSWQQKKYKEINQQQNADLVRKHFFSQQQFEALSQSSISNYSFSDAGMMVQKEPEEEGYKDEVFHIFGTSEEPFVMECNISIPLIRYRPMPLGMKTLALQGGVFLKQLEMDVPGSGHSKGFYLIFGGISDSQQDVSSACYAYHPHLHKGLKLSSMITKRYAFTFQVQQTSKQGKHSYQIFVMGGGGIQDELEENENPLVILNNCEMLSITQSGEHKWSPIADLPEAVISPMSLQYKGKVYVFGGMMKNKERAQSILEYQADKDEWKSINFKFQFGIEGGSIYQNSSSEFLIFGGRVVNGDSNKIWSLTLIDEPDSTSCVFVERGEMSEPKCLHQVYHPKHQDFLVLLGGQQQCLSCYDSQSLKLIESDMLAGLKQSFSAGLLQLEDSSLKKYTIVSKE